METKQKIIAEVKSPSKDAHPREGIGFSLGEIKQAGKDINILKQLNIKIDYFRKSVHSENIAKLKLIEVPKKKGKKRDPFVKKEKKRTEFKPITEKKIIKKPIKPKVTAPKPTPKPKKKEKVKPIKEEKLVKIPKPAGIPLTELSGLGAATAKKFIELGVNTVEDLLRENLDELATLIKGVSSERITKWLEEGKELIK
ncbi:MAG: helix-hairpin-helix domain-containing protein [Candidatus Hermodarchaeota archaeon]